jgi:serine/threonine protein phosphatase PrpC
MHRACPACDYQNRPDARFCERCGHPFAEVAATSAAAAPNPPSWRSATSTGTPCVGCGNENGFHDNYCDQCGRRRTATLDRTTLDLGTVGGATDKGQRKAHNEDAFAIGRFGDTVAAVVCDGVSSSTQADLAALAASEAGIASLLDAVAAGRSPEAATEAAALAAAEAAAKAGDPSQPAPPSCTYVSALVAPGRVTIGWVGDSRAYWVADGAARALTVDDTIAGQLTAAGVSRDDERYADPQAIALLRWLGADAPPAQPHIDSFTPDGPGTVVVCSDGLSRYLTDPGDLLTLAPTGTPPDRATTLVRYAVDAGGIDNIAVVVIPYPSPEGDNS